MRAGWLIALGVVCSLGSALVLGLARLQGWGLPPWLDVGLPIIFIGSLRGTVVVVGYRAARWAVPKWRNWRRRDHATCDIEHPAEMRK